MPHRAEQRGAAVNLVERLPAAPEVFHYENGPLAYRHFVRGGESWLAVYEASHDGVGWLVYRSTCRPLVLMPGDHVHCRFELIEDRGDAILVRVPNGNMTRDVEISRKAVVFLDEAPSVAEDLRVRPVGHQGNR